MTTPLPLHGKQARFVEEYLLDLHGTAAYQRAGYKATPHAARVNAARLLAKDSIQAAIAVAQAARAERVHLTQDAVLHELKLLATADISHYAIDDQGNVAVREGAPPDATRAISGLKKRIIHTEHAVIYETEFRLWPKPPALRLAGEHLGLWKGASQELPDIHLHVHTARDRLTQRIGRLAARHAEDATNGS